MISRVKGPEKLGFGIYTCDTQVLQFLEIS